MSSGRGRSFSFIQRSFFRRDEHESAGRHLVLWCWVEHVAAIVHLGWDQVAEGRSTPVTSSSSSSNCSLSPLFCKETSHWFKFSTVCSFRLYSNRLWQLILSARCLSVDMEDHLCACKCSARLPVRTRWLAVRWLPRLRPPSGSSDSRAGGWRLVRVSHPFASL